MGNSSCCSFGGEDKANVSLQQLAVAGLKDVSPQVYSAWLSRYKEGGSVEVLFPDGQRIECTLTFDFVSRILSLAFKDKVRQIPFSDIDSWIYGNSTIDPNSPDAELLKDPKVVGFRLSTSGRAIAVSFSDIDSAICFVRYLEQLIADNKAADTRPHKDQPNGL